MIIKQNLTTINFKKGRGKFIPEYIVVHNDANNGATDEGNAKYFNSIDRDSSAHDFVDEDSVTHVVKYADTAWHCNDKQPFVIGGGKFYKKCNNSNSIGVELCSDIVNGELIITEATQNNGAELIAFIMKNYNIPIERVIRHFDVSCKKCPQQFVLHPDIWKQFKQKIIQKGEPEVTQEEFNQKMDVYLEGLKNQQPDMWSESFRKWAEENGIVIADEDGNYQYKAPVTREQMVVFMKRMHTLK